MNWKPDFIHPTWTVAIIFGVIWFTTPARPADVALILNDQEQAVLRRILDAATKQEGMGIARMTVHMENRLNSAPAVTEQKAEPPKPKEPPQ